MKKSMQKPTKAWIRIFESTLRDTKEYPHLTKAWKKHRSIADYLVHQYDERNYLSVSTFLGGIEKHWDEYREPGETDEDTIYWVISHLDHLPNGWE